MNIKQSLADCLGCKLIDAESCILDTNSKADLTQVDVVFVAENPGKDEVKAEKPLVGKSGKTFRKYFDQYIKDECKWLLTNSVLCLTLDDKGNTANPDDETIERCKVNCFNIIKTCDPKLIVLMGTSPMKAFGIGESGITNKRGQMFKWEGYDVLLTVHPSYVNRNRDMERDFEDDIKEAGQFITLSDEMKMEMKKPVFRENDLATGKKGIHRYKIPEKFYTTDYRLVDIQNLSMSKQILYIFRDKDNNKFYHKENDDYYCYQAPPTIETRKVVPYDQLDIIKIPYSEKVQLDNNKTYEGDLRLTVKHAIDYYQQNQGEAKKYHLI
mgnify:FL=1